MDKYDKHIARLKTLSASEVYLEWANAKGIFKFISKYQDKRETVDGRAMGCLTMIKRRPHLYAAETPELTAAIVADERISVSADNLTHQDFEVFAEWQRRADIELGRD